MNKTTVAFAFLALVPLVVVEAIEVVETETYGGDHLPFVDRTYKMKVVDKFASVLSFTEQMTLDILDWDEIILRGNGNFRRPGENEDIFPLAGVSIKWRYDEASQVAIKNVKIALS